MDQAKQDVVKQESVEEQKASGPAWIYRALSIETGGIERITDDDRQHNTTRFWNATTFWFSANMAVATLNIGALGGSYGLGFWESFIVILLVNLIGDILPAWTATFGLSGLRMTTFSRYSFGYWGNLIVVIFSMISTTGWNAINAISGASVLSALSNGKFPTWAGVIVICTVVYLICVLGIHWIHRLDTFLWIPFLMVWCVAAGTGASHFTAAVPTGNEHTRSSDKAASILTYMATIFSFSISWINCAADYNVRMPAGTPRWKIFSATYVGIFVPTVLVQTLGAALYTGTLTSAAWKAAYEDTSIGGLLGMALSPAGGFGKFLMALAGLSAIPNNIPNNYSFALHAQNLTPRAARVPRIIWITFGFVVSLVIGCCAAVYFKDVLQTFLSVIGYWTIIHVTVVLEEHVIFRRGWKGYNLDEWNDPTRLPFGWAAIGAFAGGLVGAVLGMKVAWYVGPVAALIGKSGANIGQAMTLGMSGVVFSCFRGVERRYGGR
ncbi:hypothetical protein ASPCADRAFT_399920 [Aspergillus carbonarius ITEM 5010]|uniref:Purine-cytosine permease n=1 Tax=Aspergillus carbonarius (strain ITEM 5010) TaxID=602072 RepID=A0A1R3RAV5_ASPC5|nr:hypothetical protein ASPCADRAFT_399920 [Aspergillus carbonarius ITEM 5010]